jgi:hypothetical protein
MHFLGYLLQILDPILDGHCGLLKAFLTKIFNTNFLKSLKYFTEKIYSL